MENYMNLRNHQMKTVTNLSLDQQDISELDFDGYLPRKCNTSSQKKLQSSVTAQSVNDEIQ